MSTSGVSPLSFGAPAETRLLLDGLGRTEDVKLAPSGTFVTTAEFLANRIVLLPVRIEAGDGSPRIALGQASIITSRALRQPHGLHFLDDDHLVVANRRGDVVIFDISRAANEPGEYRLEPAGVFRSRRAGRTYVKTPGSVAVSPDDANPHRRRLLVCNNDWHTVSAHSVDLGDPMRLASEGVRIESGLAIPDGIDVSADRRWVAVSNHVFGQVLFYEDGPALGPKTPPTFVVPGLVCPHGLRFAGDDRRLLVGDSASPYLLVVDRHGERWNAADTTTRWVRMTDDETFWRRRVDAREGGIKGIDVDRSGRVLVITRHLEALGFYEVDQAIAAAVEPDESLLAELRVRRDRSLRAQKSDVLRRRWSAAARARASRQNAFRRLRRRVDGTRAHVAMVRAAWRNRLSRASILSPSGPVVSMATYGRRLESAYAAIESIARGCERPSRMMLWLGGRDPRHPLPATLHRLVARGLEVRAVENYGPHTKYFPYLETEDRFTRPLITADDDALYPRTWLLELMRAYRQRPHVIHAFRVHRMELTRGRILAYKEWTPCQDTHPDHRNFATGVSGVIYPPAFLARLKAAGTDFMSCCPRHDDLWLKVQAIRSGFPVAQVRSESTEFMPIPGSQDDQRLSRFNVGAGGAHPQLLATFAADDLAALGATLAPDEVPAPA